MAMEAVTTLMYAIAWSLRFLFYLQHSQQCIFLTVFLTSCIEAVRHRLVE